MKKTVHFAAALALILSVPLFSGCDESAAWLAVSPALYLLNESGNGLGGGEDTADPVGADIAGKWTGYYENDETGEYETLTATVSQDGDAVTITTSKSGPGHSLNGSIGSDANLFMTDSYDGQSWTSQRPATSTSLDVGDYTYRPDGSDPEAPEPPLQFIQLYR